MATDPLSLVEPQYMVNLKGKMHPTYPGVLAAAMKAGLTSLEVEVIQFPLPENGNLAVCQATATFRGEDGRDLVFTEIGDCDDVNANRMIVPHKLRMAATRSKGRALRDSLGIGVALVEEMGTDAQETAAGNGAAHSGVREQGGSRRDTPAAGQQSRARGSSAPVGAAAGAVGEEAGTLGAGADAAALAPVEWCDGCGVKIEGVETKKGPVSVASIVQLSTQRWGRKLCHACGKTRMQAEQVNVPAGQIA